MSPGRSAAVYGVTESGNFEGTNILVLADGDQSRSAIEAIRRSLARATQPEGAAGKR